MGQYPLPEMEELMLQVGVKMDQSRDAIKEDFAALFPEEKVEELVNYLLADLNPEITKMAQKFKSEAKNLEKNEQDLNGKRKRNFDIDCDLDSLIR